MIPDHLLTQLSRFKREDDLENDGSVIGIALSGGVDSMVLTDALVGISSQTRFSLHILHVNHGVRVDADEAEDFCRDTSKKYQLPFESFHLPEWSVDGSFENWARSQRYRWFSHIAQVHKLTWIFTAHHKDDQLETLYMRLIQNADWMSWLGIRDKWNNIRRPLLGIAKHEILSYAERHQLKWIDDPTNRNTAYLRNRVRRIDLPNAVKSNPGLVNQLLRKQEAAQKELLHQRPALDAFMAAGLREYRRGEFAELGLSDLRAGDLRQLKIILQHIIREILGYDDFALPMKHWASFWQFIRNSRTGMVFDTGREIQCLMDRSTVVLYFKQTSALRTVPMKYGQVSWWHSGCFTSKLIDAGNPDGSKNRFLIPTDDYGSGIFVRSWKAGDSLIIAGSGHRVKVSDLFINHKLSRYRKMIHPIVVSGDGNILWVPELAHGRTSTSLQSGKNKIVEFTWHQIQKK